MSSRETHKITWFQRDEAGRWQWQGFRDELQTQDEIDAWFNEIQEANLKIEADGGQVREAFVLDLDTAADMVGEMAEAAQELEDLKEWLNDVVQIEKITVEIEFDEWREAKYADKEDEDDE